MHDESKVYNRIACAFVLILLKVKDNPKVLVYKFDPSKGTDIPKYEILYILLQTGQRRHLRPMVRYKVRK